MSTSDPIERAIAAVGLKTLARELRVSHQAIRKWQQVGRMPRTEWTRETAYSDRIEELTDGQVTREQLLDKWPCIDVAGPQEVEVGHAAA